MKVIGNRDITVDSGTSWSTSLVDDGKNIPTRPTDKNKDIMAYIAANGSRMKNMGEWIENEEYGQERTHTRSTGGGVRLIDSQMTNV